MLLDLETCLMAVVCSAWNLMARMMMAKGSGAGDGVQRRGVEAGAAITRSAAMLLRTLQEGSRLEGAMARVALRTGVMLARQQVAGREAAPPTGAATGSGRSQDGHAQALGAALRLCDVFGEYWSELDGLGDFVRDAGGASATQLQAGGLAPAAALKLRLRCADLLWAAVGWQQQQQQ